MSSALVSATAGVCAVAAAQLYLHFTGNGVLFFVLPPVAFALGWTAVLLAARARPREWLGLAFGAVVVAVSAALIAQLVVFTLTCEGVVDWGNC